MPVRIFLSAVSDEFRDYRDQLRRDLTRHNVEVKIQEDFKDSGTVTLDKLDLYITNCDAVVHLVGDMTGAAAKPESTGAMLTKYPDLPDRLLPLRQPLADGLAISYTHWEAWLALYHGKRLVIAKAEGAAPRGPKYAPTDDSRAAQQAHIARLSAVEHYPGGTFTGPDNLAKQILSGAILDLLSRESLGAATIATLSITGPHILKDPRYKNKNQWRMTVHNAGPAAARNVRMKLRSGAPGPKEPRWPADYPYDVYPVGTITNDPSHIRSTERQINANDDQIYEITCGWEIDSGAQFFTDINTKGGGHNQINIDLDERWKLSYEVTAENALPVRFTLEIFIEAGEVKVANDQPT
jgi:Domain of unknown function (DUF4062)